MKKFISIMLIGILAISVGAMSFADAFSSPAQTYADLAGITVAEAYELKGAEGTFGELAQENGYWDAFVAATLAGKIAIVNIKVSEGTLSQEDANSIINQINDCDGTGDSKIGKFFNMAFGRNSETKGFYGEGNAAQNGQMNGSSQERMSNQAKEFNGSVNRFGQNGN